MLKYYRPTKFKLSILFIFLNIWHYNSLASTEELDSLVVQLEHTTGSEKLDLLKILSDDYRGIYPGLATKYAVLGIDLATEAEDDRYLADFLIRLGAIQITTGNFEDALKNLFKSLKIYEDLSFMRGICATKMWMATLYQQMKDFPKARALTDEVISKYRTLNDSTGLVYSLERGAAINIEFGKWSDGIAMQKESIKIAELLNDNILTGELLCRLGGIYNTTGQYDSAMFFLEKSLVIKEMTNEKESLICSNMRFSEYHRSQGEPTKAIKFGMKILQYAEDLKLHAYKRVMYELLAQDYFEADSFKLAFQYQLKASLIKDSLLNEEKQKEIAHLEAFYELDKKEAQIDNENKQKNLAIVGVILAILLIALLINRLKIQNKLNRIKTDKFQTELASKSRELVSASLYKTEKNRILQDINKGLEKIKMLPSLNYSDLKCIEKFIANNIDRETEWDLLNRHFQQVSPGFFEILKNRQPTLTQNELKHSAYLKMSLSNKEIARLLGINHSSVHMAQYRLKKKLDLCEQDSLVSFINTI